MFIFLHVYTSTHRYVYIDIYIYIYNHSEALYRKTYPFKVKVKGIYILVLKYISNI